jgi:hypothetical protein
VGVSRASRYGAEDSELSRAAIEHEGYVDAPVLHRSGRCASTRAPVCVCYVLPCGMERSSTRPAGWNMITKTARDTCKALAAEISSMASMVGSVSVTKGMGVSLAGSKLRARASRSSGGVKGRSRTVRVAATMFASPAEDLRGDEDQSDPRVRKQARIRIDDQWCAFPPAR